jgi:sulfate permease, SulP family
MARHAPHSAWKTYFRPRLLDSLAHYTWADFAADIGAGVTVAFVALPLAMAFAIASGLPPQAGLYTAIVAGFIISALGGSRVQIGGPAGAFIVVVYAIVQKYGIAQLMVATLMAGGILLALGLLRLGTWVRLVPVTVVIGFTNGIAVVIGVAQIKDALGLAIPSLPADFLTKIGTLFMHMPTINVVAAAMTLTCVAILIGWLRLGARIPGPLGRALRLLPAPVVVLVLATLAVVVLHPPVETLGTRFGGIPQELPQFQWLTLNWLMVKELVPAAVTLALLGAIESLLCARVADAMIDERHDPNQELVAQGLANIASPLFGGFVATGTIARTVTNVKAGARSPIAGMVHAATLLVVMWALAPVAVHVPLPALAAILLVVAYNMGEWREFKRLMKFSYFYRITLLTTFVLTVVMDLTIAVQVGLLLACVFFISRMASLTKFEAWPTERVVAAGCVAAQVEVHRLSGALFFGSIARLDAILAPERELPAVLIIDAHELLSLDNTGLEALEHLWYRMERQQKRLMFVGLAGQPHELISRSGLAEALGDDVACETVEEAAQRLRTG